MRAPVPRLALWQSWADTESAGWVRLVLDRQKVPYTLLRDEDVRAAFTIFSACSCVMPS